MNARVKTPAPGEAEQTARRVALAMYESAVAGLTPAEREALQSGLEKMSANLSGPPAALEKA